MLPDTNFVVLNHNRRSGERCDQPEPFPEHPEL